jgi:small subunit ribosomal protein S27e
MTSKFMKVKCEKCKNEQMVFEKPSIQVKCLVCGEVLAEPTGGKARLMVKAMGAEKKEGHKAAAEEEEQA